MITDVLCVGGSTRIPIVRERLAEIFGREPNIRINPDEVVAQGAAIQAGSLTGALTAGTGMGARDAVATAAPLAARRGRRRAPVRGRRGARSCSTSTRRRSRSRPPAASPSACSTRTRRSRSSSTRVFTTARDNQTRVEIDCCRGEARRYTDNEPLGTLVLEDLPPRPRGDLQIEVSFRVDADGILHVSASDQGSGMRQEAHLQVLGAPVEDARPGDA